MTTPPPSPAIRISLLVLYTTRLEECRSFYSDLGLVFTAEQHGRGPEHYAAVLADGTVLELYPETTARRMDHLRLGLTVVGDVADLSERRLTDPDGRTVMIHTVAG